MRWGRVVATLARGSSTPSLVVTTSFVLVVLTGSLGAVLVLSPPPPGASDSPSVETSPSPSQAPIEIVAAADPDVHVSDLPGAAPSDPPGAVPAQPGPLKPSVGGAKSPSPPPAGPVSQPKRADRPTAPVTPRPFKVECGQDNLNVRFGSSATFGCTLDGWTAFDTNVPILFSSGNALEGPCGHPEAFSASPPVISRSPLQAPTSFTVTVDTLRGGPLRGPIRIGTELEGSYDQVAVAVEGGPGESLKPCNPAKGSS
jgi:hypothetical protein